jgi:two-component system chemotaxis response regulator CheB
MTSPLRVLIVDDSALMRTLLSTLLAADPEIEVVGTAEDPFDAREKIKSLNPDVITLDVEMPKMNGLEFLDKLMRARPTPVVMISAATERGSEVTFRALELGAVDFVTKPKLNEQAPDDYGQMIADKIRAAKSANWLPSRASSMRARQACEPSATATSKTSISH